MARYRNFAHMARYRNFAHTLQSEATWGDRIGSICPNASIKGHDELDEDNPQELGQQCLVLADKLLKLRVLGGCCGTDQRHVAEIFASFLRRTLGCHYESCR